MTSDTDRVLIDAGLSYRAIQQRLESLGLAADTLRAVLITHAHVDHVRSAGMLSRKHGIPIYVTEASRTAWGEGAQKVANWKFLLPDRTVAFGAMQFVPFGVCHDADDTLGFRVNTPDGAIGFATDVGKITEDLISRFAACRVLVMESNHAVELLRVSPYAASVRSRIAGDDGHLSNEDVATFVRDHLGADVRCIVLAHLSRVNNVPEIAKMSCLDALCAVGREDVRVVVADQDRPTPTIDLASLSRYSARLAPTQSGLTQTDLPFA